MHMPTMSAVHPEREEAQRRSMISSTTPKCNRARTIVSCLLWTMILLSLAISVCSIIAWFVFHPGAPVIQRKTLSVPKFFIFDRRVSAEAELEFTVINENWKLNLWFSKLDVHLSYKDHEISKSNLVSFSLQKRNETSKNVKFVVNMDCHAKEKKTINGMRKDIISRKEVSFSVSMGGWVSIAYGNWYSTRRPMDISCKDLKVLYLSPSRKGKLISTDQKHDCSG